MDLDLQGKIEKFTLPEILQLIAASRKTGTLGIQDDDTIVMVYFDKGDIIYGYGPRQTFHLGQLLREQGKLTDEQLEDAVLTQAEIENSRRLGEILIEKNYIDRADLQKVVTEQVEQLLYSLLAWQSGSFKFYEDQYPTEEEITVRISVENVIMEGLRRLDEKRMVADTLPNRNAVYSITASQSGRTRDVSLRAEEWNNMALVDGHRSLADICKLAGNDEQETLTRLAQLKLAGLITQVETKTEPPSEGKDLEQMVERLSLLFEDYLTDKRNAPRAERVVTQEMPGDRT